MEFTALIFLFLLFPFFMAGDTIARLLKNEKARNALLLLASLVFYTWGQATTVVLLLAMAILNYAAGILLSRSARPKLALGIIIALNLAILAWFKYLPWFLSLIPSPLSLKAGSIPLGISFFTFHAVSYQIDIYRKTIQPAKNWLNFFTYFCMFPHLVAGPIVRFAQVQHDLEKRGPDKDLLAFGMYRFLLGINKKVLIANNVAILADWAFMLSSGGNLNFLDAWIGILAFTIQIYFDFSGYSDMAIGLAAMAGFRFEENFLRPYSSVSVREFWRRWHISLSTWLKDYLYIPLGGSRQGSTTTYRNLLIIFLVCGLWHGAEWTFIIWGAWHGLFLVAERVFQARTTFKSPRFLGRAYALLAVTLGWVFFRAANTGEAISYLQAMFSFELEPSRLLYLTRACTALLCGVLLCLLPDRLFPSPSSKAPSGFPFSALFIQSALAIFSLSLIVLGNRTPFIYFNF